MSALLAGAAPFTLAQLRTLYEGAPLTLAPAAAAAVEQSAATVSTIVAEGRTVYGINTGFGALATTSIPNDRLAELQRRLVLSHCVGVGALLSDDIVRLIIGLKILGLSRGFLRRAASCHRSAASSCCCRHHAMHSLKGVGREPRATSHRSRISLRR